MKRNVIFFLDLVVQILAIMIVMTAIASRQTGGVGLVRPGADYVTLTVVVARDLSATDLVTTTDVSAVSVLYVRQAGRIVILITARRYPDEDRERVCVVKVRRELLDEPAESVLVGWPRRPDPEEFKNRTLRSFNDHQAVRAVVRFE